MPPKIFKNYAEYYDLVNQGKNYKKEARYIASILKSNGNQKGSILEFGSGTGKHGKLLASMGYRVHGIELSSEMIKGVKQNKNFTCQQGDATKIRLNQKFDSVIALFHVASYQVTDTQINNFFANASRHLKKGGVFIFDFWYESAVIHEKPSVRVKRISNQRINLTRIAEPSVNLIKKKVDVSYTFYLEDRKSKIINTFIEKHSMRYFSMDDIDKLSKKNKFFRVKAEEFITKNKPSKSTWGICAVLRQM